MEPIRPIGSNDILLWSDGSWSFYCDLSEYSWMSNDYEVIPAYSARWSAIVEA